MISHAELITAINQRLTTDAELLELCPNIYNAIPQDHELPLLRFRWDPNNEFDTKTSAGYDGLITIDVWTGHRGDLLNAKIVDRVEALMHEKEFTLLKGQSISLRHTLINFFTESDGVTRHAVLQYSHLTT